MPLWRSGPNTRTLPTVLLTPPASKAADMAHLCVPQNQALGVCRGFVPDIQVCGTHGREDLVNATITSNAEEEEKHYSLFCWCGNCWYSDTGYSLHSRWHCSAQKDPYMLCPVSMLSSQGCAQNSRSVGPVECRLSQNLEAGTSATFVSPLQSNLFVQYSSFQHH